MLIGYRMLFVELCSLLNVNIDVDADYVEDDHAREKLISDVLRSVKGTNLDILVLTDDIYYLGLSVNICKKAFPPIMKTREMAEQIAASSILLQREIKKVGIFKYLDTKLTHVPEPTVIQCERIYPITP